MERICFVIPLARNHGTNERMKQFHAVPAKMEADCQLRVKKSEVNPPRQPCIDLTSGAFHVSFCSNNDTRPNL